MDAACNTIHDANEVEHVADIEVEIARTPSHLNDLDRGWAWVALFACFMTMMFIGGCLSAVGFIHIYLVESFGESGVKTAWVGALCTGLLNLLGPAASAISNRWSCRTCMFIGGVIGPGSLAVGSQTDSFGLAFLTIGILTGIGFGLVTTPVFAVVGYYFDRRRSLASGIAVIGVPVGVMAAPACLTLLEEQYGWRGALLVFSGIMLNLCVMAALMRPSTLEVRRQIASHIPDHNSTERKRWEYVSESRELLTNKPFIFMVLSLSFNNLGISIVYVYLPSYSLTQGASLFEIQMIYLTMGLAGIISKLLTGLASGELRRGESLDKFCLLLGAYSIGGTALCVLPSVSDSQLGRLICFYQVAFYYNVEPALYVPLTVELVSLGSLHMAMGLEMFATGIGFIIGPPLAGWFRQVSRDFKFSFYTAGISLLLSALFCIMIMKTKKTKATPDTYSIRSKTMDLLEKSNMVSEGSCEKGGLSNRKRKDTELTERASNQPF